MVQQSPTSVGPEPVALGKGQRGPRMPDDVMMVWSPQIELSFSDNHFNDQHQTLRSSIVPFLQKQLSFVCFRNVYSVLDSVDLFGMSSYNAKMTSIML